ncbi:unnamed protein product, partial [marine sediment metagenome]
MTWIGRDPYVLIDFLHALEKAEAEAEANRLAIIQAAAEGGGVVT